MTAPLTSGPVPTWVPVPTAVSHRSAAVHGVLEAPADSRARCAVLLVEPVGREQVSSMRTFVALSRELAARGAVVLRVRLRGTGDSHPVPDGICQAWAEDIRGAVAELLRRAPGLPVHALGLRIGAAALAAQATASAACVERCILWEPVGGRAYVRKAAALRRVSVPRDVVDPAVGTETPGELYTPAQVADLKALRDPTGAVLPQGWSIRVEADRDVAQLLYEASCEFSRIPRHEVRVLAQELTAGLEDADFHGVQLQPLEVIPLEYRGTTVLERLVRTDAGSPGIMTVPEAAEMVRGPAVFMVSAAAEPMDGPTGLWASAGRDLAAEGLPVLRTDRPECGLLTDPDQDAAPMPYTRDALEAVAADSRWLAQVTAMPVVGVGLCVGSWLLIRAAQAGKISRVIAFNNVAWRTNLAYYRRIYSEIAQWEGAPAALAKAQVQPGHKDHESLGDDSGSAVKFVKAVLGRVKPCVSKLKDALESDGPAFVWHLIGRTGLVDAPSVVLSASAMPPMLDLVQGREDFQRFQTLKGQWAVKYAKSLFGVRRCLKRVIRRTNDEILLTSDVQKPAWSQGTRINVHSVPELDHALLSASGRVMARSILLELLVGADSAFGVVNRSSHDYSWITSENPSQSHQGRAGARTTMI